jgi:hypothetical protein
MLTRPMPPFRLLVPVIPPDIIVTQAIPNRKLPAPAAQQEGDLCGMHAFGLQHF